MSWGNCILKQWHTTTHLLEWSKSRILRTPNAGQNVGQKELSFMAVGMPNCTATLEYTLLASYKTKHTLTIQSCNCLPWYLPKWIENLCPHKNLHMDVYCSFILKCQHLEATKMSFSRWVDKLWYNKTMKYYSVLKEMSCQAMKRHGENVLPSKRSQSEKAIYCKIPIIWHSGKGKTMETVKISMVARS